MNIRKKGSEIVFEVLNTLFMIFIILITLYPFLYVVFAAFSKSSLLIQNQGFLLYPQGFNVDAFKAAFSHPMVMNGFKNTIFILVVGVTINLLLTSLGAYFLSRKGVPGKNLVMGLIVFTMFFNGGLIPTYLNIRDLQLYNSIWALIVPFSVSAFNLIIMRTSFMAIPDSLEESAFIDGANDFTILFRIIIPLSIPVISVMILYYGVYHWNSWFPAMIYLQDRKLMPVQSILREILVQNDTNVLSGYSNVAVGDKVEDYSESIKYAIVVIVTFPILLVYPFLQKYFVKGMMIGAVKG